MKLVPFAASALLIWCVVLSTCEAQRQRFFYTGHQRQHRQRSYRQATSPPPDVSQDHYAVLGINKEASEPEIKRAFRKLARDLHPDKGGDEETFIKLREAHEVLSDPVKRREYDQLRHVHHQRGSWGSGSGYYRSERGPQMGYFELFLQQVMQSPTMLAILLGGLLAVLLALQQKDADGPPPQANRRSAEADPTRSGTAKATKSSRENSGGSGRNSSGDARQKSSVEAGSAPTPFSQATWVPRDLSDLVRRHAPSVAPLVPALLQPPSGGGRGGGGGGAPFVLVALVPRQAQGRAGVPSAQELYQLARADEGARRGAGAGGRVLVTFLPMGKAPPGDRACPEALQATRGSRADRAVAGLLQAAWDRGGASVPAGRREGVRAAVLLRLSRSKDPRCTCLLPGDGELTVSEQCVGVVERVQGGIRWSELGDAEGELRSD